MEKSNDSDSLTDEYTIEELERELDKDNYTNTKLYNYPLENKYDIKQCNDIDYGPYGSQWIHDIQKNDILDSKLVKRAKQYDKLRAVKLPEQRSQAWFGMRSNKITASDGGVVLGLNKYEGQYSFILKKTIGSTFKSNKFCYHGKKLEEIATMIYEYRMNVKVEEFGLMGHPKYDFLGASPDGICCRYKYDGKHKSKFVGRMLEIKCPFSRKIIKSGPIKDNICPIYYWIQVQLQLECCNLEECDFWQCDIREYNNREEFIKDTNLEEPFRSIKYGFEKGCLIQLIPKKRINDVLNKKYWDVVYEDAIFIYPPKIVMTPYDCDIWIADTISKLSSNPKYYNYIFDKVIYWRLEDSHCVTINRDRKWFAKNLPKMEQMWDYVLFFRKNKNKLDLLIKYIDNMKVKKNKEIMEFVDKLYNGKNVNIKKKSNKLFDNYMFIDNDKITKVEKRKVIKKKTINKKKNNIEAYMFIDDDKVTKKKLIKGKKNNIEGYMFID